MSSRSGNFANQVAQHYNQVEQKNVRDRKHSDIIELRKFNNAMKSYMQHLAFATLLNSGRGPFRVLELGCGKGGDLPKYVRNENVSLVVGVDIADVSIEQCKQRYDQLKQRKGRTVPQGRFFVADLTREDIARKLTDADREDKFHLASSQFSIHYSFESFNQAVRYISNAANNLKPLGIFMGTYPDGPKLLKLARASAEVGVYEVDDILRVEFSREHLNNPQPFGTKYHFKLKEVVDCPEFLVHPKVLEQLLKRLGFLKIFDKSFEENLTKDEHQRKEKIELMKVFNMHDALAADSDHEKYSLSENMWKVASIYRCFCYRKLP